ncbi:MAG: DnaJ domain-containing protein [Ilumatobacter sp.]
MTAGNERRNHYRLLHVQHDAPHAVVRSSYRAMMRELEAHPDRGGDVWHAALLNEAYRVLSDPEERAQYDLELGDTRLGRLRSDAGVSTDADDDVDDVVHEPFLHELAIHARICLFCGSRWPRRAPRTAQSCSTCASPTDFDLVPARPDDGRRSAERIAREGRLRYWTEWPSSPSVGELVDLSAGGLKLSARTEVQGPAVKIEGPIVDAIGRVASCRPQENDWAIGVEFVTVQWHKARGTFVSTQA